MLSDAHQLERRGAIVRILRDGLVRKQTDLVRLLKKEGHGATQSSISRDLRDLGVLKASGRYVLPPDELTCANCGAPAPRSPCCAPLSAPRRASPWRSTRPSGRKWPGPSLSFSIFWPPP